MIKAIIKLVFFSIALLAGGCDRDYDGQAADFPRPEFTDTDTEEAVIPTEWEGFKRETELLIDANQAKLRELRNTASAKHADKIAELEEKNETLRHELREFNYEDEERWAHFRDGFSKTMTDLGEEIDGVYTAKQ